MRLISSTLCRPYPFQEEILDILAAEREVQKKFQHLVVAATGTGKTMIEAFDYARFYRDVGTKPSLLFVAHREEILRQALGSFRGVLRDQNFGDLMVGGATPTKIDTCSARSRVAIRENFGNGGLTSLSTSLSMNSIMRPHLVQLWNLNSGIHGVEAPRVAGRKVA